jgi:hypothetical protein
MGLQLFIIEISEALQVVQICTLVIFALSQLLNIIDIILRWHDNKKRNP